MTGTATGALAGLTNVVPARVQVEGTYTTTGFDTNGVVIEETTHSNGCVTGKIGFEEEITLATDGVTNTATGLIPTGTFMVQIGTYVTTTVTTAVNYDLGYTGSTEAYTTDDTNVTAGDGFSDTDFTIHQTAVAPVITMNANPGAGAIRLVYICHYFRGPTS